jgi:hypothetical protein
MPKSLFRKKQNIMDEDRIKLFMEKCLDGDVSARDISLYIRDWRDRDSDEALEDFLGMTTGEYDAWLDNPRSLPDIIAARKNNIPFRLPAKSAGRPEPLLESSDEEIDRE